MEKKTLRAPFNFVPLNEDVYFPDWADKISQDIPFSDGLSGKLKLTIETISPTFIKNGCAQERDDDKINKHYSFSHTSDGRYFIPATSIKGEIRSILEIISFGKMTQVDNQSFGIRELSGADAKFYRDVIKPGNIHCGWLFKENGEAKIEDCGLPFRISAERLEHKYGVGLIQFIKDSRILKKDENRTAKAKYKLFEGCDLHQEFSEDDDLNNNTSMTLGGRKFVKFGQDISGTIVFTGQSSARKINPNKRKKDGSESWTGKFFEFVFPDSVERTVPVDSLIFKEFETIHKNSPDYKDFRKKELYNGKKIPVFFNYDSDKNTIDSIGLAYMYKYPAFNQVYNAIGIKLLDKNQKDLCECLFGYTDNSNSLKGRIMFLPAFAKGNVKLCAERKVALSSPHPSYYPLYLGGGYTWNSESIRLAGRKRYPLRNGIVSGEGTDNMSFYIQPIDKGCIFCGDIVFHNIKPQELGALLLSINLWGDGNYHNIGQGKPLGYGIVKMHAGISYITSNDNSCNENTDYVELFQECMENEFQNWALSPQIHELKLLTKFIPNNRDDEFTYMDMGSGDFKNGKEDYSKGKQLGYYSEILNNKVKASQLAGNVSSSRERTNIEKELEKREEKRKELDQLISKFEQLLIEKEYGQANKLVKEHEEIKKHSRFNNLYVDLEKTNKIVDEIVKEGDDKRTGKQYKEAIELYKKAESYKTLSCKNMIDYCQLELEKVSKTTGDVNSFIKQIGQLASPPAFATKLRDRYANMDVTDEDLENISAFIKSSLSINKKRIKEWQNTNNWTKIAQFINDDNANKLYQLIFGKPM